MNDTPDQRPVIREIIAHLGPGWTAHPNGNQEEPDSSYNRTHMIARNGDMALYIEAPERWRVKPEPYQISGAYPLYQNKAYAAHPDETVSINVGRMKRPAQVAKEITRRLLPDYTKHLQTVKERVRLEDLRSNHQRATEEMIAAALNCPLEQVYPGDSRQRQITIAHCGRDLPYGHAKVGSSGRADITLKDVDPETAIEIGQIIQRVHRYQQAQQTASPPR